jgi:D-alanyl-D-alanine carboxypeptidase
MMRNPRKNRTSILTAILVVCLLLPACAAPAVAWITPDFTLSIDDLRGMTASLPLELRDGILSRPAAFLQLMAKLLDEPAEFLLLVDKSHSLSPGYAPADLVPLKNYPVQTTTQTLTLRKAIMPAVMEMVQAARSEGVTITFSSTYRSYEYQRQIYEREVKAYGREKAERESARPGLSQHQLGTTIDFGSISDGYERTDEGMWVSAHAWEYGFSLSYPRDYEPVTGYRYESWHYRYVTKPGALMQREFFGDIQQYMLQFLHDNRAVLEEKRVKEGGSTG